jgi:hypothetical protein
MEDIIEMVAEESNTANCHPEIQNLLDNFNYVSVNTLAASIMASYDDAM